MKGAMPIRRGLSEPGSLSLTHTLLGDLMKRLAIPSGLVFLLTFAFAGPVLAAAPANDTYPGTLIGSLPFSETLVTSEATTDADDEELNASCGAPATEASVWYQFTAPSDMGILVDVSESDYSAGVIVATGIPGNFEVIACGPGLVGFGATAGVIYTILAFDDEPGGANGGTLVISVGEAPPPPEIDVTVDPVGTFDPQTGSATISGTVVCSSDAEFAFIDVELRQNVGRFVISGFGTVDVVCDGTSQSWSVEVFGDSGLFKGGHAVAVTFALACGVFDCGTDFEEQTVRLHR
jgi:hypothetical protein